MPRTETKSEQVHARITGDTKARIRYLAKAWGPIQDLSDADVIAEAVRRCWLAQHKSAGRKHPDSE
jgi:hypothetical protein